MRKGSQKSLQTKPKTYLPPNASIRDEGGPRTHLAGPVHDVYADFAAGLLGFLHLPVVRSLSDLVEHVQTLLGSRYS